ncbi:hypothetical protein L2E82_13034 [Cichorium intybus]|uniref:Uncharacterized protein n=1 Tax=Cichorium intybus TaxID=13427 RepID=A0ACB9GIU6_CICIN|nr:hypothetical protein L2E82_13034 [Cichorium intybus]
MAYLKKIKSLIGAKKVLRLLATKLRLHKLQTSKNTRRKIKKRTTTKGGSSCLSLSFQSRFKRKRKEVHRYPWKKSKPVYVDQLFLEKKEAGIPDVERISGNTVEGTSRKAGVCVADEMWESLVMGSPQMDGINERAEEFISRFRADLLVQEITARRL